MFQISVGGQIEKTMLYEEKLQEHTLYEASCQIPVETRNWWINQISFNISNDGLLFSKTFSMIVYDSECQIPDSKSESTNFRLHVSDFSVMVSYVPLDVNKFNLHILGHIFIGGVLLHKWTMCNELCNEFDQHLFNM